jgi:hypothetical protein
MMQAGEQQRVALDVRPAARRGRDRDSLLRPLLAVVGVLAPPAAAYAAYLAGAHWYGPFTRDLDAAMRSAAVAGEGIWGPECETG